MDIFGDIWVFDREEGQWHLLEPDQSTTAVASTVASSLMFGTLGFSMCTCLVVCIFMRKVSRGRPQRPPTPAANAGATQLTAAPFRGLRRGISPEQIASLPRSTWEDLLLRKEATALGYTAKSRGGGAERHLASAVQKPPKGAAAPKRPAAAEPSSSDTAEEEQKTE